MRKAILLMLFAVVSSSAAAAWVKVNESVAATGYVDTATILRVGEKVKMWELMDYKIVPDKNESYKSTKRQSEYDCKERQSRLLFVSSHSEKMGKGETVATVAEPANWTPVPPGSVGEILWKIACGKRGKSI